ncbi:uncharacterized protein BBOV_IV005800 [Babesia bovis T2Bo]|uniref:DnaJ domain containing protein n=1 Tax=Babesia bovis TaxID=5865 RepID=A7AQX2_BABBO|nr:uncharacterized protein BBOV_IV005800 [Babesia bovis T2Bo]EDO06941.1 hypothetical protein BBOV_IV005800 [Babesia bovis T2Bo]|eukprot:XP_001610509.1 hypothetical protein [Babesia bovis T2Bo]
MTGTKLPWNWWRKKRLEDILDVLKGNVNPLTGTRLSRRVEAPSADIINLGDTITSNGSPYRTENGSDMPSKPLNFVDHPNSNEMDLFGNQESNRDLDMFAGYNGSNIDASSNRVADNRLPNSLWPTVATCNNNEDMITFDTGVAPKDDMDSLFDLEPLNKPKSQADYESCFLQDPPGMKSTFNFDHLIATPKVVDTVVTMDEIDQLVYQTGEPAKGATATSLDADKTDLLLDSAFSGPTNKEPIQVHPFSSPYDPFLIQSSQHDENDNEDFTLLLEESFRDMGWRGSSGSPNASASNKALISEQQREIAEQLQQWAYNDSGELKDVRALLFTLGKVLWADAKWAPVDISICTAPKEAVKPHYHKALLICHPDKHTRSDWQTLLKAQLLTQALHEAWSYLV